MNKITMLVGLTLTVAVQARKPSAPPRLRIVPAGQVDLGELGPLEIRTQGYTFSNISATPIALRVLDLAPGVSVAGPALLRPIPPSGSARLDLRVDPEGWVGPRLGNVRLGTDDPGQGSYYLPVRLAVRPDLTVDATRRSFGDVANFESPGVQFRFARESGRPLALRVVTELPAYLEAEVRAEGPRARLAFTLRPGRVPAGMRLGLDPVQVESNAPLQPRIDLYLDWRLHHAIEATPPRLLFARPGPDALELRLKSRNGASFRILGAELEGEGFQLGQVSRAPAVEQILVVRRTAPVSARAMLLLRCSGEDEPLKVPITYLPGR